MMKAVMIVFNQTSTEKVEFIFDQLQIRGFTWWSEVQGRGSHTGEPRKGTHTWPEMNSAAWVVVSADKVDGLLHAIQQLDAINPEVGIRAFVMPVERIF